MKPCPCGSGLAYSECCEPYITGAQKPLTAEALMRSRYTAYTEHVIDYIIATCTAEDAQKTGGAAKTGDTDRLKGNQEQASRAIDVKQTRDWSEKSRWLGLKILSVTQGGPTDIEGTVEFEASYEREGLRDIHHERARFKKQDGQWLYDDGDIVPHTIVRASPKVGRNVPCPCGSGKKYKHCCGA
ncbi:MAG: YchJ family protein [Treponema sp.]|jgi:SEC-C motif-containing protein|nr:YchJ family protein [Treponema sp.]